MFSTERYLDLMAGVLLADDRVDKGERKLFLQMMDVAGVDENLKTKYERVLRQETSINTDGVIREIVEGIDPETLTWIVRDAYLMANADGVVSSEEVAIINKLLVQAQIPEDRHEVIHAWGRESIALLERGYTLFVPE
jgi:tellurite resistance protein